MTSVQQSLKKEADVVFQQHNFKKATELYTNAIDVDPSSELAGTLFSNRSLCHHKLGNFQEALKDGISATTLKPNWARGYLRVATAYESLGKEDEAIDAYQKSLDLEENEETRRIYIALFRKNVDNMKKSQEELKVIGNGYVQKKKYEEAVIIYNASIDLDPSIESAAPIYSNRSLAFFNLGRFQEAEDDGCMAIFLKPEFARGYLRRGNAGMKLEKWKESLEAYDKYFELDPESAKSDPDVVKNKNLVKKVFEKNETEKRRHEKMIEKTRAEIMAIKDDKKRKAKAAILMCDQLKNARSFDVDLARVLVGCGTDLSPMQLDPLQLLLLRTMNPSSTPGPAGGRGSLLVSLLEIRIDVPSKILLDFDELLFFVIDEMMNHNVPFVGSELSKVCKRSSAIPVNPKLLRVLLETNKFDVNQNSGGHTALVALVSGMMDSAEMPPEAPDCLHLLLNWKGIDVNAVSRKGTPGDPASIEVTALGCVRHPEVAKLLIRYGANVNAVTSIGQHAANVLDTILVTPHHSDMDELVRLLIQSGARLLPNGRGGKSTSTIMRIFSGAFDRATNTIAFVSEEVLQMILQLNQHQGLLFSLQAPNCHEEIPFVFGAIMLGAPHRFMELLFAMTPEPMKETGRFDEGELMTIGDALLDRIRKKKSSFEDSMLVLEFLLKRGLDLYEENASFGAISMFVALWVTCRELKQDLNLVKKTIVEQRGEREFLQCMVMVNLFTK